MEQNKKPLWKELNSSRSLGTWEIGKSSNLFIPTDIKEIRLSSKGNMKVAIFPLEEGNEVSIRRAELNAQYTALAVNHLASLAEALQGCVDELKLHVDLGNKECIGYKLIAQSEEALKRIS